MSLMPPVTSRIRQGPNYGAMPLVISVVLALLCLYLGFMFTYGRSTVRHIIHNSRPGAVHQRPHQHAVPMGRRTLGFKVCNGFANQRLSIVYGVILAKKLGRDVVLPDLITDGTQNSFWKVELADRGAPFGETYDVDYFTEKMEEMGIHVVNVHETPPMSEFQAVALDVLGWSMPRLLRVTYSQVRNLLIDCPLFKLWPNDLEAADEELVWGVLNALQPAASSRSIVEEMTAHVGKMHPKGHFNVLHLRMEKDWLAHCARWEHLNDGIVRNNCLNHTEDIDKYLTIMGFSPSVPLYVAAYWAEADPKMNKTVLEKLAASKYNIVTLPHLMDHAPNLHREQLALLEFFIAKGSRKFIGNSVSTFSALVLLERRHNNQWAAYYNSGNIPITQVLPMLHKLPWVFTYNSWSPRYDYMMKAAVRSAKAYGQVKPYCIFDGDNSSEVFTWLMQQNVTLISHKPAWSEKLVALAQRSPGREKWPSSLTESNESLISTFQRIDLSIVPVLNQYTYVLYTDADVVFTKPVTLDSFGLPLPQVVSMTRDPGAGAPFNSGVMLMNLPALRASYTYFLKFMLSNRNGISFGDFGLGDQGALNQFYEDDLRSLVLDTRYNSKPYNTFNPNSMILHFHGPKPQDFLDYLLTGKCSFAGLCATAFTQNALCTYHSLFKIPILEPVGLMADMHAACKWITNPVPQAEWKVGEAPTDTMQAVHHTLHPHRLAQEGYRGEGNRALIIMRKVSP